MTIPDRIKIDIAETTRYGFTDPASARGKLRKVRARQAIVVIAVDSLLRIFVLLAWAGRLATSKYVDKLITVCDTYKTKTFGIEANSMQSLFADVVQDEARRSMRRVPFIQVHQTTKVDKDFRIRASIEPVINNGRLFIQKNQNELEAELRGFPTAATKDIVDCLASAVALVPRKFPKQAKNEEVEALARYLRNTGAPSWYIEQRIAEVLEAESGKGSVGRY